MKTQPWLVVGIALAIEACASNRVPDRVSAIVVQLKCDMTTSDVEKVTGSKLSDEGQRTWGNYVLHQGTTDIWLQFDNDRLNSAQVATLDGLMKMKLWPRRNLCESFN